MTAWQHLLAWAAEFRLIGDAVGIELFPVALTFAVLMAFRARKGRQC